MTVIVLFPLGERGGEIVVTQLAPGKFCVDHYTRHADSVGILASDIPTRSEAVGVALLLSKRLGVRFNPSDEDRVMLATAAHARHAAPSLGGPDGCPACGYRPTPPDDGGSAA